MVKSSAGWAGFWIMLGIIVAGAHICQRLDCYLGVPNSCESLAEGYKVKSA